MERAPIAEPKPIIYHLTSDDYVGLHERYARILKEHRIELAQKPSDEQQEELRRMFNDMMKAMFKQDGATLDISILASKQGQDFINTHARTLDSSFKQVEMSDAMRRRLTRSNYIFSGMKTFHELHEAFPSLLDENGNRKPFERFLNDVRKIDKTYNENYLRAEHNFVHNSATMAAKWEQFMEDGDRYNLQYRTAGDDKVRPEHAALNRVTRPLNDAFWESFCPPNGWNCRCTVVQVRKSKYPETPLEEAMALGEEALQRDTKGMFRFNPGKEQRSVPDYNPYTLRRCNDCDIAKGKINLAFIPDNEVCEACILVRQCWQRKKDSEPETFMTCPTEKGLLRVSSLHGKNEKKENVRIGTYLANKHGYEIDLIANPSDKKSADSFNKTLGVYQEYKVSKTPTENSIDSLIRTAAKQADHVVLVVDSETPLGLLSDAINNRVRRTKIKKLTIIVGNKDATYSRDEMLSGSFKIRQADLK